MSTRVVSSHKHIKPKKRRLIIKEALRLGVIHEGGKMISKKGFPLLHCFTQGTLRMQVSDLTMGRVLIGHINSTGGETLSAAMRSVTQGRSRPTYIAAD